MATLEERISAIEQRNLKVERDKGWETSFTRRVLIFVLTYIVVAVYLKFVVGIDPWINALVPSVGFLLSTLTLSYCRTLWERNRNKR